MEAEGEAARLEAVEIKLAHLERAIQELSGVVYRQQRQLDGVLEANRQLRRQLDEIEGRSADPTAVELPPHY
ncbi:MAG: SlyX family protein [Steroidobacteraceae bacterium]